MTDVPSFFANGATAPGHACESGASVTADGPPPLLQVTELTTWFRTARGPLEAIGSVSFAIAAGETLGIVGESGSGKSVLARTIMRLIPPNALTTGDVRFDGRDLRALSREQARAIWGKDVSMIFQDPMTSLNPVMRIRRQITESLKVHLQLDRESANRKAAELLRQVGIPEPERRLDNYPHELSGGMRQRVCIAIALACSPRLLFADEPTTALDVTIQRQILDMLTSVQRERGMAMVLITHDLGVVAGRTQRVIVMYGGRVMETGPTEVLFHAMRHPYTAALLASIPRVEKRSHTRLAVVPGRPADVIAPPPGCRFATRCRHAQELCLQQDPPLVAGAAEGHSYACFYPVGTPEGDAALEANLAVGHSATGLPVAAGPESEVAV